MKALRTIFGSLVVLAAACACSSNEAPTSSPSTPFAPALPPSAITDLFGGQTGSDESASPCDVRPGSYQPDEATPLGLSGNDAAEALTMDGILLTAHATARASFTLEDITSTQLWVLDPEADTAPCNLRLSVTATARLTTDDDSFNSFFPVHIIASSLTDLAATGVESLPPPELLQDDLQVGESLRIVVARDAAWQGWLTAYDLETYAQRPLAELRENK